MTVWWIIIRFLFSHNRKISCTELNDKHKIIIQKLFTQKRRLEYFLIRTIRDPDHHSHTGSRNWTDNLERPWQISSRLPSKNLKIKIYKTIILPVVLYGCETWSLTLREEFKAKGIWKHDPEANIWAQEGWECGVEKAPQWGTS